MPKPNMTHWIIGLCTLACLLHQLIIFQGEVTLKWQFSSDLLMHSLILDYSTNEVKEQSNNFCWKNNFVQFIQNIKEYQLHRYFVGQLYIIYSNQKNVWKKIYRNRNFLKVISCCIKSTGTKNSIYNFGYDWILIFCRIFLYHE